VTGVRVAVIGTGFGGRVVAPAFAATEGCEVVDVVSARDDAEVRRAVQRPDADLVSVHSPPFLHADHVRLALAAGKAVLCDKPFAMNADEARELEQEAHRAGVVALCNFEFRYAPARTVLRDLIADGTVGRVEHVQWTHLSSGSRVPLRAWGWLFDRAQGGGWIGAWASHAIDALRFVTGAEVAGVEAQLRTDVRERVDRGGNRHACTAEDGFTATLTLTNGTTVAIDSGYAAVATFTPRLTVFGDSAVVDIAGDDRVTIRLADGSRRTVDIAAGGADSHEAPMRRFAMVVRDAVATRNVPVHTPTFADGRECDQVLDRLRAAPFAHHAQQ